MISVIITTCCRPLDIIKRAVQSVLKQTYKAWELIVVDDSPNTFEARKTISEYFLSLKIEQSVLYVQNEKNSGACFSRNKGLEKVSGEYVAYLDDDDEWLPDKLLHQYIAIEKSSSKTSMVYCPYYLINQRNQTKQLYLSRLLSGKIFDQLLLYGNFVGGTSVPLIRTACLKSVGGFDIELQASQDYDVWLRLAEKYEIIFISEPLVNYYMHYGQPQITTNQKKKIQGRESIIKKYMPYLSKHRKSFAARYRALIPNYAAEKMYFKAIKIWFLAVAKNPGKIDGNCKALYSIIRYFFINLRVKS